jgi:hypothetical protein
VPELPPSKVERHVNNMAAGESRKVTSVIGNLQSFSDILHKSSTIDRTSLCQVLSSINTVKAKFIDEFFGDPPHKVPSSSHVGSWGGLQYLIKVGLWMTDGAGSAALVAEGANEGMCLVEPQPNTLPFYKPLPSITIQTTPTVQSFFVLRSATLCAALLISYQLQQFRLSRWKGKSRS